MTPSRKSPGPAAARAFTTGILVAAVAGLAVVGFLYWSGTLAPLFAGFTLVVLFPVYMLVAASVLSKWLGYDRDPSHLRRVVQDDDPGSRRGRGRP